MRPGSQIHGVDPTFLGGIGELVIVGSRPLKCYFLIIFQACERVAVLGARSVDSKGRTLYSGVKLLINVT